MLALTLIFENSILDNAHILVYPVKLRGGDGDLYHRFLLLQLGRLHSLLGLSFQHGDALCERVFRVFQELVICVGTLQFALCLRFLMQEFGHACRFLEYFAALRAFCVDYLRHASLSDDRISLTSETGTHEHFLNVLQAHLLAVYEVFAVAGAVELTGDDHLVGVTAQRSVGIVDSERDLGEAHLLAGDRSVEDNVLHFVSAQGLRTLLTHDPTQRVAYVALAVAVAPDHGGHFRVEIQHCLVSEGFEALNFKCLEVHISLVLFLFRSVY